MAFAAVKNYKVVAFGNVFADWLRTRCIVESIPDDLVSEATLTAKVDPDLPHPSDFLGPFDRWSARCELVTDRRTYVGELRELGELRSCFAIQEGRPDKGDDLLGT